MGVTYLTQALHIAETLDHKVRQIFIHHHLGKRSIDQAMYDQALTHFQQALHCAQSAGLIHLQNFAGRFGSNIPTPGESATSTQRNRDGFTR